MNPAFFVVWKRRIKIPLIPDFHFGIPVPEAPYESVRFSTFDARRNGEVVKYSKNVFTMPAIMGEYNLVMSGELFGKLHLLIICKHRIVNFHPFCMPWSLTENRDYYQDYLKVQTRRCELEGIPEWEEQFAFGHNPEDAYQYYENQHGVAFSPDSDYIEMIAQFSSECYWNHRDHTAELPHDLLIVGPTTVDGTDFARVTFGPFCESAVEPRHRSQTFVSPAELETFGMLKANARAYFCRPDVYALLEPHLDPVFWCYQPVTQDMIPTPSK